MAKIDEIIEIVKSIEDLTIADYGPTHSIISDYNLCCGQNLYNAQNDYEGWLFVLDTAVKRDGRDFRTVIQEIELVLKTLDKLMKYTDEELEQATDRLYMVTDYEDD